MEEITRFQQLRQPQHLSDEEKLLLGLPLYPDGKFSDLANTLMSLHNDKKSYNDAINRYLKKNESSVISSDLKKINSTIRSMYDWINFKAKPLKLDDFKKFVRDLDPKNKPNLNNEWFSYADNMVIAINNGNLTYNSCVDFQQLIRICYIFKLCIKYDSNKASVIENVTNTLLNKILDMPILLPMGLLRSRCKDVFHGNPASEVLADHKLKMSITKDCTCPCETNCQDPNSYCICFKPYIADLFVVKEELARFEEADIADIENILAGEEKVRRHRTLQRTEESTESEKETITSEERDHQVNEKFSLASEVKKTVDAKVGTDAGVTATLKYGSSVTLTPHANVTSNNAKSESENTARSYAKEIIDRSITKIQEKTRMVEISKITNEIEERNKHLINNSHTGAEDRAGIYYWVNKVSHAQVFNYGKRMMFDVIVPEPAAQFKMLYEKKYSDDSIKNKPEAPVLIDIDTHDKIIPTKPVTVQSITRENYAEILNYYMIATNDDIQPPEPKIFLQTAFSQNIAKPEDNKEMAFSSNDFKTIDIPDGYMASSLVHNTRCSVGSPASTKSTKDEVAVGVHISKSCIFFASMNEWTNGNQLNQNWGGTPEYFDMNGERGSISISVAGFTTLSLALSGTISITCTLTPEAEEKWRAKIYNLIMSDYNRRLEAYKANETKDDKLVQIKGRNPFLNREIERNELKRHIIAILMCSYFNKIGSMMEKVKHCGYPEINFEKLEKDTPLIQFFEQIFEWNYITYLFYHSMWARKCKWPELIDQDSGDPLFDKFLMSGASRVQVPIRPGMEEFFIWFMQTGQLWGRKGIPPVFGEDGYISMIQEIKESKQYDYIDRPGTIDAYNGKKVLKLTDPTLYYWDEIGNQPNNLNIDDDADREILVNYKIYRIVKVEQDSSGNKALWNINIDRPFEDTEDNDATNLNFAVGAKYVGAPWEIVIPTKLVYLRNENGNYKLPVYPLSK